MNIVYSDEMYIGVKDIFVKGCKDGSAKKQGDLLHPCFYRFWHCHPYIL